MTFALSVGPPTRTSIIVQIINKNDSETYANNEHEKSTRPVAPRTFTYASSDCTTSIESSKCIDKET